MITIGQKYGDHEVVVKNTFLEYKQDEDTCDASDFNSGSRKSRVFSDSLIEYSSSGYETDCSETGSFAMLDENINSSDEDDLSNSDNESASSSWSRSTTSTPQLRWADITEEDADCSGDDSFTITAQVPLTQERTKERAITKPVQNKLQAVQQCVCFDGQWNEGWICGDKLIWNDGEVTQLQITSPKTIRMTFEGKICQGTLLAPGVLRWDDGDLWYMIEQSMQRMAYVQANQMRLPCVGSWPSSQQRAHQQQRWV